MDTSGSTPPERPPFAAERPVEAPGNDATGSDVPVADATENDLSADHPAATSDAQGSGGAGTGALFGALAVYTLLRIALVAALTAVLSIFMPLIVALLFAIVVQLPLAWLLFSRPRTRLNDAIAQASARRRAERSRLQAGLTGEPSD